MIWTSIHCYFNFPLVLTGNCSFRWMRSSPKIYSTRYRVPPAESLDRFDACRTLVLRPPRNPAQAQKVVQRRDRDWRVECQAMGLCLVMLAMLDRWCWRGLFKCKDKCLAKGVRNPEGAWCKFAACKLTPRVDQLCGVPSAHWRPLALSTSCRRRRSSCRCSVPCTPSLCTANVVPSRRPWGGCVCNAHTVMTLGPASSLALLRTVPRPTSPAGRAHVGGMLVADFAAACGGWGGPNCLRCLLLIHLKRYVRWIEPFGRAFCSWIWWLWWTWLVRRQKMEIEKWNPLTLSFPVVSPFRNK